MNVFQSVGPINGTYFQRWSKSGHLCLPVKNEGGRYHNQVDVVLHFLALGKDKGDDLYGFTQTHIIGQAGPEVKIVQKVKPVNAFLLVLPQFGMQGIRHFYRHDAFRP
ncbi:hypothetical protein D3C87_1345810 [compost metagenome]